MATAWKVNAGIAVVGWLVSPIITFYLPRIISSMGFDASEKLRDLKLRITGELKETLRAVDQARMLQRREVCEVSVLDDMAAMLRHAREETEDILDDAEELDLYRNRWLQRLYDPVKAAIARCVEIFSRPREDLPDPEIVERYAQMLVMAEKHYLETTSRGGGDDDNNEQPRPDEEQRRRLYGVVAACKSSCMSLLQWTRNIIISFCPFPRRSDEVLPVTTSIVVPSHEPVLVTTGTIATAAHQPPPAPVTAPSDSSRRWLSWLCTLLDFIKNQLGPLVRFVCLLRDWPYHQGNPDLLDVVLTCISRRNLKKRIETVESTVTEVKNSPLLVMANDTALEDIANKNRSRIRTANNSKTFGREALRDSIMEKLRETPGCDAPSSSTSLCYSVIGIYGVAGSGKTTFARYIRDYIKEECKGLFDTLICIHVSKTSNVGDIFREMLKDITKDQHSNISDHEELEEKLKESLCGKRFFLILDDLWVKSRSDPQLQKLISPLNIGKKGSKILVTARTKDATRAMCVDDPIKMPDLDEDQYFSMFMHYALGDTNIADEKLISVGREIAKKLHRSPIAAAIVAGQLGTNPNISYWKSMSMLDMSNGTMDALWWSYQQLSPDIRRCFEYCNIFPRRFKMKKGKLVHLWIAQGFIKTRCATEDMEDVAEGYIQELVSCSFLQPKLTWDDTDCFGIHDLLHDLLDKVIGNDYFKIENENNQRGEGWKGDVPRDLHHVFVQNYDAELISEKILGLRNLRTLIIDVIGIDTPVEEKVIESICKKLPKLRVLAFAFSWKGATKFTVPDSVSQLKHIRYLAFRTFMLCTENLPSSLNKLQHIQLLDFSDTDILGFTFAELVNLRHLFCWSSAKLPYLGRLSSLQTLSGFRVSNEQGCELKQLRNLNRLRGELYISGLENVNSKREALEANLAAKRLTKLALHWSYEFYTRFTPEFDSDVLEGLCPHVGLENFRLWGYRGSRYPDWMMGINDGGPKKLQELVFCNCVQLVLASGLAEAFPHLRVLKIEKCSWEALPGNMEHLMSLKELEISKCQNIRSVPKLPQSLEVFFLHSCKPEFMESCKTVDISVRANLLRRGCNPLPPASGATVQSAVTTSRPPAASRDRQPPAAPGLPGVELAGQVSHLDAPSRNHEEQGHHHEVLVRAGDAEAALPFHGRRRTRPHNARSGSRRGRPSDGME